MLFEDGIYDAVIDFIEDKEVDIETYFYIDEIIDGIIDRFGFISKSDNSFLLDSSCRHIIDMLKKSLMEQINRIDNIVFKDV